MAPTGIEGPVLSNVPAIPVDPGTAPSPNDAHMAEAMSWGHQLNDYATRYGAVTGVALIGLVIAGVLIKKFIKKKG